VSYFIAIWYMFPRFGTFYPFWYVVTRKSGNPVYYGNQLPHASVCTDFDITWDLNICQGLYKYL
jgi:hypothetical protein